MSDEGEGTNLKIETLDGSRVARVATRDAVSSQIDAMLDAVGDLKPGMMMSFSLEDPSKIVDTIQLKKDQEEVLSIEGNPCPHCSQYPCIWYSLEEGVAELADPLMAADVEAKQIRYTVYRHCSLELFGNTGKGNRKKLPQCVVNEIHDCWPAASLEDYTGFKEGSKSEE